MHSARELIEERGLITERQQVLRANPELFSQRMASMKEFQAELETVIARRMTVTTRPSPRTRRPCTAALDWRRWCRWRPSDTRGGSGPNRAAQSHLVDDLQRSFDELGSLVSRSLV